MAPPLLMLEEKTQETHNLSLFSLKEKNHAYKINLVDQNLDDSQCVGSSHGWLAFLDEIDNPFLLNPFSKTQIHLPKSQTLPTIHSAYSSSKINKVVLCKNPSHDENYVVVVMHSIWCRTSLAFCRYGDEKWTNLESGIETLYDVVCCDETNTVFVLGPGPVVEIWDMNETMFPKKKMIIQDSCPRKLAKSNKIFPVDLYSTQWYLALSKSGQMFLVVRYIGEFVRYDGEVVYEGDTLTDDASEPLVCPYKTVDFHVFKYCFCEKKWIEVESLGNYAMFLGGSQSMMVSTKEHAELKGNVIYFTDDYWDRMDEDYNYGGHDMGIYSMEDGCIDPVLECQEQRIVPPPFWINVPHDHRL
ncbi:hypothetical protein DH2020_048890 [Rehmannia glutinosa]|uniref:KIB1-4 beta-propeller domain-containing protein n=1 Tax=Rehmannia glutinosa TaxID=99300 RepID=A0ABR0U545_REHGL